MSTNTVVSYMSLFSAKFLERCKSCLSFCLFSSENLLWLILCQVESLAKKYEEKYKQVAELASKLAVEEAAYRDVQVCLFYTLEKIEISVHILSPVTNK
jgi:hypothetical protein